MTYKRYEKYKDSGIEWIGEIPEEWKCEEFRRYTTLQQGLQIAQEKRFYEAADNRLEYITIKYINSSNQEREKEYIEDASERVICSESDILLARTGATGVVVTNIKGVFHNNFFKVNYNNRVIIKDYLVYYLKQQSIQEHFKLVAGTTTIPDLNHGEFLSTKCVVPSMKEQKQIANFLDKKTSEIDALISDKEKLIELLKEKRQAIITETVTKGLNPNVKMKDSGVQWIGEIPEHWKISKIKYSTYVKGRIGWQGLKSDEFTDEGPFLVTGTDFVDGYVNWESCYHISEDRFKEAPPIQLKENDLLITKDGTIGKIALVKDKPYKAILNSGVFVTRCINNEYLTEFLYWVLCSEIFNMYIKYMETGSTIKHLYQETFVNFSYPLPSLTIQEEIIKYLNIKIGEVDKLISTNASVINELNSYKQSLISEAVTGKIDVRDLSVE